jgi:hypothetical protein
MLMMSENISPFPTTSERLAKRGANAMNEYLAGLADVTNGRQKAIRAVIEYGKVLLEGRKDHDNNAFKAWVTDNGLDVGNPWKDHKEREKAMRLAEMVVGGNVPPSAFDVCPRTRPVDIMKWYRKQHPSYEPSKIDATKKAMEAIKSMEILGEPVTRDRIVERANVSDSTAYKALAIRREQKESTIQTTAPTTATPVQDLESATAHFSEKSKLTIDKAINLHKKRLDALFETKVGEEVRRHLAAADEAMRKQNAQLRKENLAVTMLLQQGALFSPADFKTILMCLHPDNSASSEVRARAFDLVRQKEKRLIGKID